MKRLALNQVLITALICSAVFTSCNSKESRKLLECIADENGNCIQKFEYDEQNRIVKIHRHPDGELLPITKMITYGDNSVTVEEIYRDNSKNTINFIRNGNTITRKEGQSETITVNKDGYIGKREGEREEEGWSVTYQYKDGNLIKNGSGNYEYDSKPSPFSNCNTPKWLLQLLLSPTYASKNNLVKHNDSSSYDGKMSWRYTYKYKYEYDSDGFPVKVTKTFYGEEGDVVNTTTRYTYYGETKNATAKTETSIKKTDTDNRTAAALQFIYTVEFNNKKIPMTVFYSEDPNNEIFYGSKIDSLVFVDDGKTQTAVIDMESQIFSGDEVNWGLILAGDYNFDGYMDIAVLNNRGVSNAVYNYFIYNPRKHSYYRSEALSGLMNASFDAETKTVKEYNVSGAGRYYTSATYKWDGIKLELIQSENQEPNEDDVVIRITRTLQEGKWIEKTDTVKFEE